MADPTTIPAGLVARRRLWDLPEDAHEAVLGTSFPGNGLRVRLDALFKGRTTLSTAALHAATARQCAERNKVSERLNTELERRHRATVRRYALAEDVDALRALWVRNAGDRELAGPLWAALTHRACDTALTAQVLGDLRHAHYGALSALQALADENAILTRELARVQQRSTRAQAAHAEAQSRWQAELQGQRTALAERDAVIAMLRAGATALPGRCAEPALRQAAARTALLEERVHHLQQALQRALHDGRAERSAVADDAVSASASSHAAVAGGEPGTLSAPVLKARSVLCVGGRPGQIPIYRDLVERHGGRFAHHDGGIADRPQQLDAVLAAADLVICQAGCISHNAYWLVKDHCKRTGKHCVYLHNPSVTSFERGLSRLPVDETQGTADD